MMTIKATPSATACRIADRSCGERSSPGCLELASPQRERLKAITWRVVDVKGARDIRKESGSYRRDARGEIWMGQGAVGVLLQISEAVTLELWKGCINILRTRVATTGFVSRTGCNISR
jgi:hypothetical protein